MIIGYCRQGWFESAASLERQRQELSRMGAHDIFCDGPGAASARPELRAALNQAQSGDLLLIRRAYQVARTSRGVLALIKDLARRGVAVRILNTPLDTSTTTGRMILASTPVWSLNISPVRSFIADLAGRGR